MRRVKPEAMLLASPKLNWVAVSSYLESIGGQEWVEQRAQAVESNDAADLIEFAGRLCYRSWTEGLNANVTRVRRDQEEYFDNLLDSGHGSVLEHANFTFVFNNVSRVFTHELVRHRAGAAYSQESMRFVRLTDIPFWFPTWATEDEELMQRSLALLEQMEAHQLWMAEHFDLDRPGLKFSVKKAKTSFMRRFAPDGVATSIVATFNVRALRHIITMRTEESAEEEIRIIFDYVYRTMLEEMRPLFRDFTQQGDGLMWVPGSRKV